MKLLEPSKPLQRVEPLDRSEGEEVSPEAKVPAPVGFWMILGIGGMIWGTLVWQLFHK
ncbi:MAG: hypothetical protein KY468_20770 [Armatimonadetes bacterium]|nr:hypothetical protein [Armatimonadota bacterium]